MSFQGKQALVTGGAGFIGSNLAIHLVRSGAKVRVIDAFFPELGGNDFNLAPVKKEIELLKEDLGKQDAAIAAVKNCDYIFNLAGNVSHIDSMTDPFFDNRVNTEAQISLLEACRKQNPQAVIVFSSTRQIYGSPQYLPVDEKHPILPVDVNGVNKLAAEHYHQLYAKVYGLNTICLRLTNTYGPRQLIRHGRQGFVGWFLNRAITGNDIQLFGGGDQIRDFTYVDDLCEAMMQAALTPSCYKDFFNIGGFRASVKEIAEALLRQSGKGKLTIVPFPEEKKKIDIGNYYCSAEKFSQRTGWQPKTSTQDGLEKMTEYFCEHKQFYL